LISSPWPDLMYSYRPTRGDVKREAEVLLENKIWFSTPDQFNDPFELQPHFHFAPSYQPEESVINAFTQQLPNGLRDLVEAGIRSRFQDVSARAAMEQDVRAELLQSLGRTSIACFAESDLQIRMWSYYASSHKGVCFGFNFDEPWICGAMWIGPEKVVYQPEYPAIQLVAVNDKHPDADARMKALLTKAEEWSGEREWRCLRPDTPSGHQAFPVGSLKKLVFGARIEREHREAMLSLVKQRSAPVEIFQARVAPDRFELTLERVKV